MFHRHRRPSFKARVNVPMVTETRDRLALEIRMAGESLIGHPSIDAYNVLSKMLAALERAGMSAVLLHPGTKVMNTICDRYEESGSITVEPEEANRLRQVIAAIDVSLHRIPLQRFTLAVAEVETFAAVVDPTTNE